MDEQTMRNELHDAKEHAKDAVRASLMAMRNIVDFALNKIDGDGEPAKGDNAERGAPADPPPPPPNDA